MDPSRTLLDVFVTDAAPFLQPLRMTLFTVGGTPINAFDLIEFVMIFAVSYILGRLTSRSAKSLLHRHGSMREESTEMFAKFLEWGVITVGVLIALSVIGLPVTHLAILVSALSVGIGFGLQTIVNNLVAGLILLSEKAVSIGNIILTPQGKVGRVNMITIRATRIVTPLGEDIIIPNSNLIDKSFANYSINPRGVRKVFQFSIPYGTDFHRVKNIIENAATQVPYCIPADDDHEVECGITGFGNFGINVELVCWVDANELMEPFRLEAAFLECINNACVKNNITIPGPNYVVTVNPPSKTDVTRVPIGIDAARPDDDLGKVSADDDNPDAPEKVDALGSPILHQVATAPLEDKKLATEVLGVPQQEFMDNGGGESESEGEEEPEEEEEETPVAKRGFFKKAE